eukprot:scaffold73700_cov19-Tisochrysis_lutea.AAC.1
MEENLKLIISEGSRVCREHDIKVWHSLLQCKQTSSRSMLHETHWRTPHCPSFPESRLTTV